MMKWTVLSDNRAHDPRMETEHGLSVLLETERLRVLLDTGASDIFIRNAEKLGVDLGNVDYVFVSHGHADHAGGLRHFLVKNQRAKVIVSPEAVAGTFFSKRLCLHSITPAWPSELDGRTINVGGHACELEEGLRVIARIPSSRPKPQGNQRLYVQDVDGNLVPDDFRHEQALYVDGLLFTGCAHCGLENILEACPWLVHTVVGGFHLLDGCESEDELTALAMRLKAAYPHVRFYTGHCTGDVAFEVLHRVMGNRLFAFSCGESVLV